MILLKDFIRESVQALSPLYEEAEARSVVLLLCQKRLGVKSYTHIVEPGFEILEEAPLQSDIKRLMAGEPVQYVLGYTDFCGRRFNVDRRVLIPRPETGLLVEEALRFARTLDHPARILDLCTGSGCIAWSLALELPDAEVVAVDISGDALEVARSQFPDYSGRVKFVQGDILDMALSGAALFDLIVSNPPYIMESQKTGMRPNVLDYEPGLALFVPDGDPLVFYRAISCICAEMLAPSGLGIVEINDALPSETLKIFVSDGYRNAGIIKDFALRDRLISFSGK